MYDAKHISNLGAPLSLGILVLISSLTLWIDSGGQFKGYIHINTGNISLLQHFRKKILSRHLGLESLGQWSFGSINIFGRATNDLFF